MWLDLKVKIVIALNFKLVNDKNSVHVISSQQKCKEMKKLMGESPSIWINEWNCSAWNNFSPTWKEINLTTLPSNHSYLGDVWKRSNRNLVFISHCDPSQTISFLLHLHAIIAPIIRIRVNLYSCMMDNILTYIKYMHGNHIVCLLWTMRHMINYTCHWIE